jgi:hypothetical protein
MLSHPTSDATQGAAKRDVSRLHFSRVPWTLLGRGGPDVEGVDDLSDPGDSLGDGLGACLLLRGGHGAAQIDRAVGRHHAEAGQVRVLLADQTRLDLGLDTGVPVGIARGSARPGHGD